MSITSRIACRILLALIAAASAGCGGGDQPDLGTVKGTVTLDGKPLAGAIIVATPEIGRPGLANVDADGKFELQYIEGVQGTKLGRNKISFTWPTDASGPPIPAKYGEKSELTIDVKKGANSFDFKLESDKADEKADKASAKAKTPAGKAKAAPPD
jgi:hypothetical protein